MRIDSQSLEVEIVTRRYVSVFSASPPAMGVDRSRGATVLLTRVMMVTRTFEQSWSQMVIA
jgi:hypothetical protein